MFIQRIAVISTVILLTSCGAGTGSGGLGAAGATSFIGIWTLVASISVNVGGTSSTISDTTIINVASNGVVTVSETDTSCGIAMTVSGEVLNYQTTCIFAVATDAVSSACTLTMNARAVFGNDTVSGVFGPETLVCTGVAASYAGTLAGFMGTTSPSTTTTDTTTTDTTTTTGP